MMEAEDHISVNGLDDKPQNGVHAASPTPGNLDNASSEFAGGNGNPENVVEVDESAPVCSSKAEGEEELNAYVDSNGSSVADQAKHSKIKGQGKKTIDKPPSSNPGATSRVRKSKDGKDVDADVTVARSKQSFKSRSFNDRQPSSVKQSGKPGGASPVRDNSKGNLSRKGSDIKVEESAESSPPVAGDDKPQRVASLPAYGFSFKCDERAEKRKEFYSKLEQKINAKEAEKNTLQAKSQENQEAEIKMLRKSLIFKATPMPSFYQEPTPPKVELKKMPTTRAKSPKLGRKKSGHTSDCEDNGTRVTRPVRLSLDAKESQINHQKKPLRKSLPKLPSEDTSSNGKPETTDPTIDPIDSHPIAESDVAHAVDNPTADQIESQPMSVLNVAHVVDSQSGQNLDQYKGEAKIIHEPVATEH